MQPGPRNLITDVPGFLVGNAGDAAIKSGTTVLIASAPFVAGVSILGGAPGTRETDLLAPDATVEMVDALVLSGGSAFGLEAASGVTDHLRALGRGFLVAGHNVPIVPGAILFDLPNGGDKGWTENPYRAFGMAAAAAAAEDFALGSVGAGTGGTTADLMGGLGSASLVLESGVTVGALVAVNALGSATVGEGAQFWAAPFEFNAEFGGLGMATAYDPAVPAVTKAPVPGTNTTIAIVATDAAMTKAQARRMATAAHDGMARALVPSHTPLDGDLVFAAATGARPMADPINEAMQIGHAAAICLARAIARGVHAATPLPGNRLPCWSERFGAG